MLHQLKRDLEDLLGLGKVGEVLPRLLAWLVDGRLRNDVLQLSQGFHAVEREYKTALTIDFNEYSLKINAISRGLTIVIAQITDADLNDAARTAYRPKGSRFYTYNCNRTPQIDALEPFRASFQPGTRYFFYLYGGDRQAHQSFFKRVAFELEGRYQAATGLKPLERRAEQVVFTIDECSSPDLEAQRRTFVRNLFDAFGLTPDHHHPLLQHHLGYVFNQSDAVRALQPTDYLCVFVHVPYLNWNPTHTPTNVRWLADTFCQCPDHPNHPAVLFFFAFDYDEDFLPGVREEILAAIQKSPYTTDLPELHNVPRTDVARWMLRHQQRWFPDAPERRQLLDQHFPEPELPMEVVEERLRSLVNNRLNNAQDL